VPHHSNAAQMSVASVAVYSEADRIRRTWPSWRIRIHRTAATRAELSLYPLA